MFAFMTLKIYKVKANIALKVTKEIFRFHHHTMQNTKLASLNRKKNKIYALLSPVNPLFSSKNLGSRSREYQGI